MEGTENCRAFALAVSVLGTQPDAGNFVCVRREKQLACLAGGSRAGSQVCQARGHRAVQELFQELEGIGAVVCACCTERAMWAFSLSVHVTVETFFDASSLQNSMLRILGRHPTRLRRISDTRQEKIRRGASQAREPACPGASGTIRGVFFRVNTMPPRSLSVCHLSRFAPRILSPLAFAFFARVRPGVYSTLHTPPHVDDNQVCAPEMILKHTHGYVQVAKNNSTLDWMLLFPFSA